MQRDIDLAHKVLYFVEEHGKRIFKGSIIIEGYERDAVVEHLYLLADGGFVNLAQETLADKGTMVLTWKGCDYLDELRAKEAKQKQMATQQQSPQRTPPQNPAQRPQQPSQQRPLQQQQRPKQQPPAGQQPQQQRPATRPNPAPAPAPAPTAPTTQPTS